ncbi:hypothetical protein NQZ68_005716 [Dissostichus eleginoides]|nr:hypothetical protein NQZ68_005716 [Dissostichus eleginoides]
MNFISLQLGTYTCKEEPVALFKISSRGGKRRRDNEAVINTGADANFSSVTADDAMDSFIRRLQSSVLPATVHYPATVCWMCHEREEISVGDGETVALMQSCGFV